MVRKDVLINDRMLYAISNDTAKCSEQKLGQPVEEKQRVWLLFEYLQL